MYLLQLLNISLFSPLISFYKSIIKATCKFEYIFFVNKLVFLDLYFKAYKMLRLRHALPSGTRGLMSHDYSLSLAPPILEPSALLLLLLPSLA
jgi:hypothetical protein